MLESKSNSNLIKSNFQRDFRERRLSTTSMEIEQPRRRERRVNRQTFYPLPSSFSEPDNYEYSSDEDDTTSIDSDGYKNTLVRKL